MGFHSVRPRARRGSLIGWKRPTTPDPYSIGSANFAERHRQTTREHPSGLVQVDMGEPPPRYT